MKSRGLLLVVLLMAPLLACDEEVKLGDALSDVKSAAPGVCKEYCAWAQTCVWNSYDFEQAGPELQAAKQDWQQACLVTCANRSDKGAFGYQREYGEGDDPDVYTINEHVDGGLWTAYYGCLWDNEFWICGDSGSPEIEIADEAACTAFNTCVQILEVALQYNWNPDANDGAGECQREGFDFLWDGGLTSGFYTYNY
jgi:hypothetical protein